MSLYVLDTSTLLAYIENEDGVKDIEQLLLETLNGQHRIYISVVSCIELFYISLREQGQSVAIERLQLLDDLPLVKEALDEQGIISTGELKARHAMSFADCCIAGLAKQKKAILMHKDPEFEQLKGTIALHPLPYKTETNSC